MRLYTNRRASEKKLMAYTYDIPYLVRTEDMIKRQRSTKEKAEIRC